MYHYIYFKEGRFCQISAKEAKLRGLSVTSVKAEEAVKQQTQALSDKESHVTCANKFVQQAQLLQQLQGL